MGLVEGKVWKSGDSVAQQDLNEFTTNLEAVILDDQNTASNWATQQHFDPVNSQINEIFDDSTQTPWTTSSNTWTTVPNIALGNIMPAESGRVNLVRVQWSGLVGENSESDDIGPNNLYAIRCKVQTSSGAAYFRAYSVNKFTGRTWNPIAVQLNPDTINWMSISGSGILLIPSGLQITGVTLEAIVYDNTNSLELDRMQLQVIIARA